MNPAVKLIHFGSKGTVESIMHKIFKDFRVDGSREWYSFDEKTLKQAIHYIDVEFIDLKITNPLKARVQACKNKIERLGVKSALYYFCLHHEKYQYDKRNPSGRAKNLWYCKITDEDFTTKLEEFVINKTKEHKQYK